MEHLRHYDIVVDGSTVAVTEAGPSRGVETVVIVGASDAIAASFLTQLGRIVRTIALDDISAALFDALDLVKPHVVLVSDGTDVTEIVHLLQRTVSID